LKRINSTNKGTVNLLDSGLAGLVQSGLGDQAADFLADFLSRSDVCLSMNEFDSFSASLFATDSNMVHRIIVKWLLSGTACLCFGVEQIFRLPGRGNKPIAIDFGAEILSSSDIYFICRKVVGYLFMEPIVAASILISAARTADFELVTAVQDLLYDPLMVNYDSTVKNYLCSLPEDDPAYECARQVVCRGDTYLEGLRSPGEIKELHPSEQHRLLERIRFADQMSEVAKGAEKKSVFYGLVRRSTLLHGNRSVSFIETPTGERKRFEMELRSHGITRNWPRIDMLDPTGLEETLFMLRVERRLQ
jgi:hypothetical protein